MTTMIPDGCRSKEDEGGGGETIMSDGHLTNDQYQRASALLNQRRSEDQQTVDIFVKHLDQQERHDEHLRERRSSLPSSDAIELTTLSGVVRRRKQQFQQLRYQQQPSSIDTSQQEHHHHHQQHNISTNNNNHHHQQQQHLMPVAPKSTRPLSISSISSAASSGSSSSANSSSSSGVQSSLTRNGSLNYGHSFRRNAYLASIESLNNPTSQHSSATALNCANNNHHRTNDVDYDSNSNNNSNNNHTTTTTSATTTTTGSIGGTSPSIEEIFKNLNLSGVQLKDAATRAAVLAAGESQRRGFGTPGNSRISRINRSLHASLRYDKNTAYRIHLMANARALSNASGNNATNQQTILDYDDNNHHHQTGRGNPISRHDSSTSSDSGHVRESPRLRSSNTRAFVCPCRQSAMTSSSSASQVYRAVESDKETTTTTTTRSTASSAIRKLFNQKAATLDSVTSQRTDSIQHHPNCTSATNTASNGASCPLMRPRRASAKLQPSPSSASSHSNTSSLFRDDGFEDDLTSTTSEQASSSSSSACNHHLHLRQRPHRLSFQGRRQFNNQQELLLCQHGEEDDDYQSCEEEFEHSQTTASTTSNLDDCGLSTTSSSMIHHEPHTMDEATLAIVKKQYRKSLLLEHQQQQHLLHSQHANHHQHQNKIQALLQPPPKLCHLPTSSSSSSSTRALSASSHSSANTAVATASSTTTTTSSSNTLAATASNTGSSSSSSNNILSAPSVHVGGNKLGNKCEDRTVNIIGHMPTRSPGYWDSNLSITQRVVTEIIETERTYVDDLEQIVTGYICYLRNVLKQQKQYKQQQARHQNNNQNCKMVNNSTTTNKLNEDDDTKSMSVFEDENTCPTNDIDDCDVEEAANDISMREEEHDDDDDDHHRHHHARKQSVTKQPTTTTTQSSDATNTTTLVSAIDIKKLFSNLEDIYKFNKDLLFRLEECYLNPSSVAECFVENALGFDVYTQYCTNYPQVVSTLTELMADPATGQLLKERQHELNQSLPLGSYLLKPVQRILKYHILFQSLIKHTTVDEMVNDKDQQLINEAFSVMTSIACHINAMKKRHEHAIRVQEVQGLLCGWEGPDLTTLGELILEDTFKLYNRQRSARHLFLFDNVLLITKKKRDGSLCYKGHIECSNLMLIENIEGQPLVFNTVPFDNPKALCSFQAKNLDKKRDWCLQMKEVIIKSFEVKIPVHVRDILMSLTNTGNANDPNNTSSSGKSSSESSSRAIRAPNYLQKKRTRLIENSKKQK